jgi:hypothetical protein
MQFVHVNAKLYVNLAFTYLALGGQLKPPGLNRTFYTRST